jgi:hypothetical protein
MVTVPMPFQLNSIIEMDSGWDGQHPSNPVTKWLSMALDSIEWEYLNELYLFFKPSKVRSCCCQVLGTSLKMEGLLRLLVIQYLLIFPSLRMW